MFEILRGIFWIYLIFIFVAAVWQIAEKEMYGQITPRRIDDIVGLILAISLYFNIK